jgi:nucleobase:cation symporter-1, NCS1 family
MAYWATDTINLGTWETASSIIAVGLTWREALPIMVVGTFCVAVPVRSPLPPHNRRYRTDTML